MSGARPTTPEELDLRAGEYVLGVLDSAELRAVERDASLDPQLARAVADWERRLAPMLTAVAEVAPPDALWARIAQAKARLPAARQDARPASMTSALSRPPVAPAWPRPVAARRVWPWQAATGASLALAAGLAAIMVLRYPVPSLAPPLVPPPARPSGDMQAAARAIALVAVLAQPDNPAEARHDTAAQLATDTGIAKLNEPLPDPADQARSAAAREAGFLAALWPDGTAVLTAFAPVPVAGGRTLELWIKPPDAAVPRSLGILPAAGRQMVLPAMPAEGTTLSVTLEPPGGSPTGAPTGRVVFAGTLRQLPR